MRRMNRLFFRLMIASSLILLLLAQGCGPVSTGRGGGGVEATFTPGGVLRVTQTGGLFAETAEVLDASGSVLSQARFHGRATAEILFRWDPGTDYTVRAGGIETRVESPANPPAVAVRLRAPSGQAPSEHLFTRPVSGRREADIAVPASPGDTLDLLLEIEQLDDGPPISVEAVLSGPGVTESVPWKDISRPLAFEFDSLLYGASLSIGPGDSVEPVVVSVILGEARLDLRLWPGPADIPPDAVRVSAWEMPTSAQGLHRPDQPADRILMRDPVWERFASWFGIRPVREDVNAPHTWQAVTIANTSAHDLALLAVSEVLSPDTGLMAPWFNPPDWQAGGGTNRILATVQVPAGGEARCVLPVHVDPATPAGAYIRRVTLGLLGSDRVLTVAERPLGVVRTRPLLTVWVAFASTLSLLWLAGVLVGYRRLVGSLGVRALVLVSLLGSLQFCLTYAGGWVSGALYAILGPFNFLVGGFLTEVLTYLVVTAILFVLPRVGAMTLAGLVTYLMGGILFGSFGLTDVVFVGSAIAFKEILLLAFGVTRFRDRPDPPRIVPMMIALGLADAAATFTGLALYGVFYRLFYADWYIVMNVVVTGFLYTAAGVWLGRGLGRSLRKVRP
jgi:hypothetical protein